MSNTEKQWTGDVMMMYPKQWVILTDLERKNDPYKVSGYVHFITSDENEARLILKDIRASKGAGYATVVEGFDDTPQIGGLELWNQ